jgi:hypothetical protein
MKEEVKKDEKTSSEEILSKKEHELLKAELEEQIFREHALFDTRMGRG